MKNRILAAAVAGLLASAASAQQQQAPRETVSAQVGMKKVSVEYGRPSLKGRAVDELLKQLPADRLWRAGFNQVTTLTTEGDVLVGGKKVPAGKYSLSVYAPLEGDYALAVNSDKGTPLGKIWDKAPDNLKNEPWPNLEDYDKNILAMELVRVPMKKVAVTKPTDLFTVTVTPGKTGATLTLAWGDRAWSVELTPATK
jgi:hypothetical protein